MSPTELTRQAFELYYIIRIQRHWVPERSERKKRLHLLGRRAFYRYMRRLKAESGQGISLT
ncbi:MAG: hypothetical protein QX198_14510 [Methylococcaceae bacterium]